MLTIDPDLVDVAAQQLRIAVDQTENEVTTVRQGAVQSGLEPVANSLLPEVIEELDLLATLLTHRANLARGFTFGLAGMGYAHGADTSLSELLSSLSDDGPGADPTGLIARLIAADTESASDAVGAASTAIGTAVNSYEAGLAESIYQKGDGSIAWTARHSLDGPGVDPKFGPSLVNARILMYGESVSEATANLAWLKAAGKTGGKLLEPISIVFTAKNAYAEYSEDPSRSEFSVLLQTAGKTAAATAGGTLGTQAGCSAGGSAGSAIAPGPGTAIGCAVGGFAGGLVGEKAGKFAWQYGGEPVVDNVVEPVIDNVITPAIDEIETAIDSAAESVVDSAESLIDNLEEGLVDALIGQPYPAFGW